MCGHALVLVTTVQN